MSDLYQYGETIDITIRGAQVFSCGERGLFINVPGDASGVKLPCGPDGKPVQAIDIERVSPAGGPVEVGDLWRDARGRVWLAYRVELRYEGPQVWMTCGGDNSDDAQAVCRKYGPLTLVFREALVSQPEAAPRRWRDRDGDIWVDSARDVDSVQRILPDGSLDPRFPYRADVDAEHGPLVEVTAEQPAVVQP